jgi:phospholipid/cholesterol/gamma-HCH transport system ATP-binding protein
MESDGVCRSDGAAGSGKTVLLKTAIGLIRHEGGRTYLFGQDITELPEEELYRLRRRVGVLFQEGALFDSLTVEENVAYPLLNQRDHEPPESEVQARVKEALAFVDLAARRNIQVSCPVACGAASV